MSVLYSYIDSPIGRIRLAATPKGLCGVGLPNEEEDTFVERCKQIEDLCDGDAGQILSVTASQLEAYFSGSRQKFDIPFFVQGTAFQTRVWDMLSSIPYGQTMSYKQVAEAIGSPAACRAVGLANSLNPIPLVVPCHRVIGTNGKLVGFGGGVDVKRWLLRHEGILID